MPASRRRGLAPIALGAVLLAGSVAVLPSAAAAQEAEAAVEVDRRLPFATRRAIEIVLDEPGVTILIGESRVAAGDTISGPLVQLGGRLVLAGTVTGDVTAVDADVAVEPGASIGGRVAVLGGSLRVDPVAVVRGERIELPDEPLAVVERPGGGTLVAFSPPVEEAPFPLAPGGLFGVVVDEYNGVDGLAFGLEVRLRELPNQPPTELAGGPVFRTERFDEVGWLVRGSRALPRLGVTVGGRLHSISDTAQRWHRPDFENSVAALLFAGDDRAYFEREGYRLWVEKAWAPAPVRLLLRWRDDEIASLESERPFALFADNEDWPVNPPAEPGEGRALGATVEWDRRNDAAFPTAGAYAEARYDRWGFGGDFEFDWGQIELQGYVPAGRSFGSLRVVAGGRLGGGDTLAPQFLYRLGGSRTIVGYDPLSAELTGDRAVLLNLRWNQALPIPHRVFRTVYLVGLADAGDAWLPGGSFDWEAGLGAGLAGRGETAYLGVFAAYGVGSEEWHAYVVVRPWF